MGHMTWVAYFRVTRPGGRLGLSLLVLVLMGASRPFNTKGVIFPISITQGPSANPGVTFAL
jgi:hypothetical protein